MLNRRGHDLYYLYQIPRRHAGLRLKWESFGATLSVEGNCGEFSAISLVRKDYRIEVGAERSV